MLLDNLSKVLAVAENIMDAAAEYGENSQSPWPEGGQRSQARANVRGQLVQISSRMWFFLLKRLRDP